MTGKRLSIPNARGRVIFALQRPWLPFWLCVLCFPAAAQDLQVPGNLSDEAPELFAVVPALAKSVIAKLRAGQSPNLADDLFRAQLAAGFHADALHSLSELRAPLSRNPSPRIRARYLQYVLYAKSKLQSNAKKTAFEAAYRKVFRALISPLDDATAAEVLNALSFDNRSASMRALKQERDRLKGTTTVSFADAAQLIRDYTDVEVYRALGPETLSLIEGDDAHRYAISKDLRLATPDNGTICVLLVRPTRQTRLAALLEFTIYNDSDSIFRDARRAAANGYAAVVGLTRGKGCSADQIVPYEHDGADAAALIDWTAAQSWSDGRVGMYGGSYSGFTTWAAAKYRPKALKAIMVGAPNAPGIDSPMEGNVFWNFIYPWPLYTAGNKTLDNATYGDSARWERLNRNWYSSGRAYRDLDKIDGTANPIFDRWLTHPSYDDYWQRLIPYKREFAGIDIPVLQTAGYYFGGPGAAVYFLCQHYQYRPQAEHYLIIGPYDHFRAQRGTATADGDTAEIAGYTLDPAALIDLVELRFRWFDYVLKHAPKPAILADRINYQVTGANVWRHAASIAAMAKGATRFYLSAGRFGQAYELSSSSPVNGTMPLTVDFADRRDAEVERPGGGVQDKNIDTMNGLVFISEPLAHATEMSGLFAGHLEFISNKEDFDFQVSMYELTAAGDYIQLAPYWSRASYVGDLSDRRLLIPGQRQTLDFRSMRLMSRKLAAHSRLVAVLSIIKEPGREINYGTGKIVSEETIADSQQPLQITWFAGSYIDMPGGSF